MTGRKEQSMKEQIIEMIALMNEDQQKAFYLDLIYQGLTRDEIQVIQNAVFYHKLFTNPDFYQRVQSYIGDQIIAELKGE